MRFKRLFRFLWFCLAFAYIASGYSQTIVVGLHTDRNAYVSGDVAFIKVYAFQDSQIPFADQTLFIDLAGENDVFVCGQLMPLKKGLASGYIEIPDTLSSGYYQMRVYTENSKSLSNPFLDKKWIYLSNRFGKNEPLYHEFDSSLVFCDSLEPVIQSDTSVCQLLSPKITYKQRRKVTLNLGCITSNITDTVWASVAVKALTAAEQQTKFYNISKKTQIDYPESYLSDGISGVLFRGQLIQTEDNTPITDAVVLLTFQDTIMRLSYDLVDEHGNFCFNIQHNFGEQSAYLSAFKYPSLVPLKHVSFRLEPHFMKGENQHNESEQVLGYKASTDTLNIYKAIVAKAYQERSFEFENIPGRDSVSYSGRFLSGNLTDVVKPTDFVDLVDFAEIAKEILPFIRYKKHHNVPYFAVIDGDNQLVKENPMVFVDGVPLVEAGLVAGLNTAKVKQVEVKTKPRIYGDLYFENGIIYIWTTENNFWSLHKSDYLIEVPVQLYQNPIQMDFPDYSKAGNALIPDFRQTLYWNPQIVFSGANYQTLEFFTSDETGWFEIEFQGYSNTGQRVLIRKQFKVEEK